MEQWNGQQRAFTIKMFYKNNDSLEGAQRELDFFNFCWVFQTFLFFCVSLYFQTHVVSVLVLGY